MKSSAPRIFSNTHVFGDMVPGFRILSKEYLKSAAFTVRLFENVTPLLRVKV
jgi:hypothetical protein